MAALPTDEMIADLHDDVVDTVSKLRIDDERIQPFMFLLFQWISPSITISCV
jgi:hypothetical protein